MATPQPGIFIEGTRTHRFQEYAISDPVEATHLRAALRGILSHADGDTQVVLGVGPRVAEVLGIQTPNDFRAFEAIGSPERSAPATQHDLWVWIHGDDSGAVFDVALNVRRGIDDVGSILSDTSSFVYHDNRDLTGFIDGTENPEAVDARELAVVSSDRPGAGGSTVLVQRWVHDLDGFHGLTEPEQVDVIGRTKPDSVELAEDVLPDDAHIARVVMEDDSGDEIEIYRRSVPFGDSTEAGLLFVAFTDELAKIDNMVKAMFGPLEGEDAGIYDRITDFSQAVSGSYFFAPSQEVLNSL